MTNGALEQLLAVRDENAPASAGAAVDTSTVASSVQGFVSVDATRPSFFIPGINGRARCIQKENDLTTKRPPSSAKKNKRPPRGKRLSHAPPTTTLKKTTSRSNSAAHKLNDPVSLKWITIPSPDPSSSLRDMDNMFLRRDPTDLESSTHSETIHLAQELCDVVMSKVRKSRSSDRDVDGEEPSDGPTLDEDERRIIDAQLLASEYAAQDRVFSELRATLLPPKMNLPPNTTEDSEASKFLSSPKSPKKTKKHGKHTKSSRGESGSEKSKRKHKKSSKKQSKQAAPTLPEIAAVDLEESRKSIEGDPSASETLTPGASPRSVADANHFTLQRASSTSSCGSAEFDVSRASRDLSDVAEQEQHMMSVVASAVMHKNDSFLPNRFFEPSPSTPFCPFDVDEGPTPNTRAGATACPIPPPPPFVKGDSTKHDSRAACRSPTPGSSVLVVEDELTLSKLRTLHVSDNGANFTVGQAYGYSPRRQEEEDEESAKLRASTFRFSAAQRQEEDEESVKLRASTVRLSAASPSLAKRRQSSRMANALVDHSSLASF